MNLSNLVRLFVVHVLLIMSLGLSAQGREIEPDVRLAKAIQPWIDTLTLKTPSFAIEGTLEVKISGKMQPIQVQFVRQDDQRFSLHMTHPEYEFGILRCEMTTAMVLPKHKKIWLGIGAVDAKDHIAPQGALDRLVSDGSMLYASKGLFTQSTETVDLAGAILFLSKLKYEVNDVNGRLMLPDGSSLAFAGNRIDIETKEGKGALTVTETSSKKDPPPRFDREWLSSNYAGFDIQELSRHELEKTLSRGLRRAFEVFAPSPKLTSPKPKESTVDNGKLMWIEGQRVVLLWGTPEQIGTAHGQLLREEATRCIDSVIYGFGAVQTIATGKWFRSELEAAYHRLAPHIPERHKVETRALAKALNVDPKMMEVVNVFPELFHCSGFAVFGSATQGGKLYHGRVLDYMTTIGLQDAATTFIVAPNDFLAFANVGYGGFIGSVSGMNQAKVSLGEMGGRGEGKWDGVPMATLMRRALEECNTLSEVETLWKESPRTCEYYYVFADGKDRSAVGVAATPEKIEFVRPGEGHPLLGEGIKDTVLLSAGSRLDELKKRVRDSYGKIDVSMGQQLMCRPVAMSSNLHNVLFVPEDLELHVANADHRSPAADRRYSRFELGALLKQIPEGQNRSVKKATDSIPISLDGIQEKTKRCLEELLWKPSTFDVSLDERSDRTFVRFPSALNSGNATNDRVALEWFRAKGTQTKGLSRIPAVIVVHESGRSMKVGQLIAAGIANQGLHAFMIHLPHYGERRTKQSESADVSLALKQSIADVRRAYDAVAVLSEVDRSRISLQGTSLGGFVAATTAGIDDRFHSVVMLLAGGDLYGVVTEGKRDAQKFRLQMEAQGLDDAAIRQSLAIVEPLNLAHRINAERAWLYSGKFDDVVAPRHSKLLADAAKLPSSHHIEMEADHYSGILLLPSVLKDIARLARE